MMLRDRMQVGDTRDNLSSTITPVYLLPDNYHAYPPIHSRAHLTILVLLPISI